MRISLGRGLTALAVAGLLSAAALTPAPAGPPDQREVLEPEPGIDVQPRGPVHEGFAQPGLANPKPEPAVAVEPPSPVPEEPPDQKPEGANVQWLPGYWAWDPVKADYVWVSGCWRVAPEGRRWVPGHWAKTTAGWQWAPGFWAEAGRAEVDYLAPPPDSLDAGPASPAPDADSFYVPGCWRSRGGRYVWRPGLWSPCRRGWVWVPSTYVWTPAGCVFVAGYWDYPLEDRGCLFAPVCFSVKLWLNPRWCYRPCCVVRCGPLLSCCWLRPGCGHYYFGGYYGPACVALGFQPWFLYGPRCHDPLFGYYGWRNRGNPFWAGGLRRAYLTRSPGPVVAPFRAGPNLRLTPVSPAVRAQQLAAIRQYQSLGQARARLEVAGNRPASGTARSSLRLPASGTTTRSTAAATRTTPSRGGSAGVRSSSGTERRSTSSGTAARSGAGTASPSGAARSTTSYGPRTSPFSSSRSSDGSSRPRPNSSYRPSGSSGRTRTPSVSWPSGGSSRPAPPRRSSRGSRR